ncbi:MAG: class I SAM-dependent methyltransferase [Crocinitomicaceae bacterium]|nr:class I SAM-dependent methyltransferase [Crocinitomicaceae bacterium]
MKPFKNVNYTVYDSSPKEIFVFHEDQQNIDEKTVASFGDEWTTFSSFSDEEIKIAGDQYFDIVADDLLNNKYVLDVGCGTGRWTKYVAEKAAFVECIDPSDAVFSAAKLLKDCPNTRISKAGVDNIPFEDDTFDLVFSLGVLHHIPDTLQAMKSCVKKVKPGGSFLVYLYYNFENRGFLFKSLFFFSNILRRFISSLPKFFKTKTCWLIAVLVYMPFVLLSKGLRKIGLKKLANKMPLSYYTSHSFNIIKNDALDRFGTPLEQRFSRKEITEMMVKSGLSEIIISDNEPYWHAIGKRQ